MGKTRDDDTYQHILKYTGLFGGVQGLNILVGIVRNKLVAMILGPDGMGLSSLFSSTVKLVSDSTTLGIPMTGVRDISEAVDAGDDKRLDSAIATIRCWSLLTALLGMVVCVLLGPWFSSSTFAWGDHTLHFVLLSPAVALIAITGGETAILKGTRRLRSLAVVSVYNMFIALFVSVPIYYVWGQSGIVPSLVLLGLGQCVTTVCHSYRFYPPHYSLSRRHLRAGHQMIRLGLAFVLAGILGSGAEFLVRSYLNNVGELETVGLYNAGFVMTMTYAGMVFSAMETDYFPRLSGIASLGKDFNRTVSHQVEVSLLLISPILVVFLVALPVLLPLLYSGKFTPVLGMMRWAVLAMYLRAINLPVEYVALARGDSRSYLFLEAVYDVLFVLLVMGGYEWNGLTGTGTALAAASLINTVVVYLYARWRYGYAPSANARRYALMVLPIGVATCFATERLTGATYWLTGLLLAVVATVLSVTILHRKTKLWNALKQRAVGKVKGVKE